MERKTGWDIFSYNAQRGILYCPDDHSLASDFFSHPIFFISYSLVSLMIMCYFLSIILVLGIDAYIIVPL